jgi:hypothetical protein
VTNREHFEDLPLDSRADVIYERSVHVEPIAKAVSWPQTFERIPLDLHPEDVVRSMPGWYAIIDAEGDLVCLVPPGGIDRDAHADDVAGARAAVVAAMLNREATVRIPPVMVDDRNLRLVTVKADRRVASVMPGTLVLQSDDDLSRIGRALVGRSLDSVHLMCTFEDLHSESLRKWLAIDVATRLVGGARLRIELV